MGTIFGVWPGDKLTGITGRQQAAAGMGIYGPRTVFCIALKVRPAVEIWREGGWVSHGWLLLKHGNSCA